MRLVSDLGDASESRRVILQGYERHLLYAKSNVRDGNMF